MHSPSLTQLCLVERKTYTSWGEKLSPAIWRVWSSAKSMMLKELAIIYEFQCIITQNKHDWTEGKRRLVKNNQYPPVCPLSVVQNDHTTEHTMLLKRVILQTFHKMCQVRTQDERGGRGRIAVSPKKIKNPKISHPLYTTNCFHSTCTVG